MNDAVFNINGNNVETLQIIFMLTMISLLPTALIMMTSFVRIVIVLSFTRNALGLQQTPPNTILIGMALFLTFFIMSPVIDEIDETAYRPYRSGEISQEIAVERAGVPLKHFMLKQTEPETLNMFLEYAREEKPENLDELKFRIVVPSFITSELKRAFLIGFLIFIPFLIIDMVVSSTLMSMGMMMLPPATISLPFKILLFIVVNGWTRLFEMLMESFNI